MSRALTPKPRVIPPGSGPPFAVLTVIGVAAAGTGAVWVGGHAASLLSGRGWTGPPFGVEFASQLATRGPAGVWPRVPPELVWALSAALVLAVLLPVGLLWLRRARSRPAPDDPVPSLAQPRDVESLTPAGVAARAVALRPSLRAAAGGKRGARRLDPAQTGVGLGELRPAGPALRASWEDVLLAVMAPRAGKTTAMAVPAILDAPGAVVATSNKSDLWATTAAVRAERTGEPVWVFDPQAIVFAPRSWWWNPLRGVATVEEAHRLAGHFIQEVRSDKGGRDFWSAAAHDLLTGLVLAAGSDGRTLSDVYEWLNDVMAVAPAEVLRKHGHAAAASSLAARQNGAPETVQGVYETARTAAQCLRDPHIMAWVTPPARPLPEFSAAGFALTRQSLYLLSKDGAGAAAPLIAALTDRVLRESTREAERRGGRLDPPLVAVLDEAANVCRIADLPDLYSHLGSRGIVPLTILQSYRQGVRVWGEDGMAALWSAATVKVLGAGLDDARLADDISRLVGEHDVPVRSLNVGDGRVSESTQLRRQRILGPEDVRALPRMSALVMATGAKAAMVRLQPWYAGSRAAQISAAVAAAGEELTARARSAGNPAPAGTGGPNP